LRFKSHKQRQAVMAKLKRGVIQARKRGQYRYGTHLFEHRDYNVITKVTPDYIETYPDGRFMRSRFPKDTKVGDVVRNTVHTRKTIVKHPFDRKQKLKVLYPYPTFTKTLIKVRGGKESEIQIK